MEQIGRYQIVGELGRGAMGIVYRALDPAIGRTIAIKTIRLADLTDPSERERLRERLVREAQSAGILSHPGIVTIYDIAQEGDMAYVFMEFVDGPPLDKMLEGETPPGGEALLSILHQTAVALDYAHRKGIVHRDIKPANIMIAEDGSAKITDFGVAKIVSQQMTQAGAMMGTPSYMSPEQVQGIPVDGRADQFSLGVIAYELLTGEKPFAAEYLPTLLYKIVREEPAAPQRLNPTLDDAVEAVLRRALAKSPDDRFPTCAEFTAALVAACQRRPGWQPMPRGSSHSQPTVATTGSGSKPAMSMPPPPAPAPYAPPLPPPSQTEEAPPARRRARLDEQTAERSGGSKKAVLVVAGIVLIALMGVGARQFLNLKGPSSAGAGAAPVSNQPPAAAIPAAGGQRPSPAGDPVAAPASQAAPKGQPPAAPPLGGNALSTPEPAQRPEPRRTEPSKPALPGIQPVQIATTPPGASVVVDNDPGFACTTPCSVELKPGRHTLAIAMDGYRRAARIFNVPQESALNIALDRMTGKLSVRTSPPGASIYVNGALQADRTPALLTLPAGRYKIAVVREGFAKQEDEVQIRDGGISDIEWSWEK